MATTYVSRVISVRRWVTALLLAGAAVVPAACGSSATTNITGPTPTKCQVTLSTSASEVPSSGGNGTLTINSERECSWSASANAGWIALASTSGQGPATIDYSVQPNPNGTPRKAQIVVSNQSVDVLQDAAPCKYAIDPQAANVDAAQTDIAFALTATPACQWTAKSSFDWIRAAVPSSGTGNATVRFTVMANPADARAGTISIGDAQAAVQQAAAGSPVPPTPPSPPQPPSPPPPGCSIVVAPMSTLVPDVGADVQLDVTATTGCDWVSVSNAPWITIKSGLTGSANGTVIVTVAPNSGPARSSTVSVGGVGVTINQAAAQTAPTCTYQLTPPSVAITGDPQNVSVSMAAPSTCQWLVASNVPWITVADPGPGVGAGPFQLAVAANPGAPRTGTVMAGTATFTVNQAMAVPCTYSIKPTSYQSGKGPDTITIDVTAGAGCAWTATSPVSWVTVAQGATGTGNGQVILTVDPNPGSDRATTLTIAGQPFQLTQKGH